MVTHMILRTLKCLVVFSLALVAFDAQAKDAPNRIIAAALDPLVADQQLAGYVTVLMKDGKPVATNVHGYADIAAHRPLTKENIFRIFSMTKPVTGVALMILHDRGKWKFSDPVAKFLPELANLRVYRSVDAASNLLSEPAAAQPTMGQLVTHTAGDGIGRWRAGVDHTGLCPLCQHVAQWYNTERPPHFIKARHQDHDDKPLVPCFGQRRLLAACP
jgi:CubicO group peptidase (beta-lactamase class C family)